MQHGKHRKPQKPRHYNLIAGAMQIAYSSHNE